MVWTGEKVDQLRELYSAGNSFGQIVIGVTRNAVIGKCHRLDFPKRGRPQASDQPRRRKRRPSSATRRVPRKKNPAPALVRMSPRGPIGDLVAPVSLGIPLIGLNDSMCKWPIGDPMEADFHFCGHRNFNGLPYCEYHSRLSYQQR